MVEQASSCLTGAVRCSPPNPRAIAYDKRSANPDGKHIAVAKFVGAGFKPAPTRTTSVAPLRGLGLGCGLLVCDCPAAKRVLEHGTAIQ
jgi:hypothetical protein